MFTHNHLEIQIRKLPAYCQANDWAGYDPYDAVNSRVFALWPFLNSRLPRLVLTQALKRSPTNIRRLLLVPKTQNPKAIALFLSVFLKLSRIGVLKSRDLVEEMIERLMPFGRKAFLTGAGVTVFPGRRAQLLCRRARLILCARHSWATPL
jgi:hypothetical protein